MALNKRIYYVRETVKKVASQRWGWEVQCEQARTKGMKS